MKLKNNAFYKSLMINDVYFKNVRVFILDDKIEIVDNWSGLTIATIFTAALKDKEVIENE